MPLETQAAFTPLAQAYFLSNINRRDASIEGLSMLAKQRIALAEQIISAQHAAFSAGVKSRPGNLPRTNSEKIGVGL
ncbi:MAG: hypothetical protein ACRER3_24450 [Pseudomonas fluorescens]